MKINVFEGARRIAKLAALIGVLIYGGTIAYEFTIPDVHVTYLIKGPGIAPVPVQERKMTNVDYDALAAKYGSKPADTPPPPPGFTLDAPTAPPAEKSLAEKLAEYESLSKHRVDSGCEPDDLSESRSSVPTRNGREVWLTLCFRKWKFSDGRKLVPYKVDLTTNQTWGNESGSSEVIEYTKRTINAFVIPPADEDWIAGLRWSKRWGGVWKAVTENAPFVLGWLAFLWAFTWAVGWIVRGFLGIPKGNDLRPPRD
jgi:hypothetical protein